MLRALLILALGVSLGSCGSSSGSRTSSTSAGGAACGPRSGVTIASTGQARVYAVGDAVFGCSTGAGGPGFRLGSRQACLQSARVAPIAMAGAMAAYGLARCGVDTGRTLVVLTRLTDGRRLLALAATTAVGVESYQSVGSIAVRRDGAIAWIGILSSVIGHRRVVEVHAASGGGASLLDSGGAIEPTSLRLNGSTVTWRRGGAVRSARLS